MKKTFTIRIKPKLKTTTVPSSSCEMSSMYQCQIQEREEREEREERKVERQEECCAEIQSLRCEIEKMKTEMNEMRQQMKQMQ